MLKILFVITISLVLTANALADFVLETESLAPGGVAMLCWQGSETPHTLAKVSFSDNLLPVIRQENGPCALVGVDLEQASGLWPLTVESVASTGERHLSHYSLRVESVERPAQRLTLPKQMVTPTDKKIVKQIAEDQKRLNQVFSRRNSILFSPPFFRPVDGEVISAFGLRRILNGIPKSPHNGIDFRAATGTPIKAIARGEVALADNLYYTGKTIVLDHGGGLFSVYAHLDSFQVSTGAIIDSGTKIGTVGSTGRSTGPHLHLGTRLGRARIDPLALINLFAGEKKR